MFTQESVEEWQKRLPKCGCGRVGRYETPTGLACNKYMRCDNAEFLAEQIKALTAERDKLKAAAERLLSRKRPGAREDDPRLILEIDCMNLEEALKESA